MFIGIHIGFTYTLGFLIGKFFNVSNENAKKLAILASIFGVLPDLDYFIQVITGLDVHRLVAHSVIIGLLISLLLVFWNVRTAILAFGTLFLFIIIGIFMENKSLYFVSFSFAFIFIFAMISYIFIKPDVNKKIILLSVFLPYVSHVLFDLLVGGSAAFFPIPYILTGQIFWVKLDVFPDTGHLPIWFWVLELAGAFAAITMMISYQYMSYKKYGYTVLAASAALLIFYLVGNNYISLDEVVIGLIVIYLGEVIFMNSKIGFMIMNCWAGFCILTILSFLL